MDVVDKDSAISRRQVLKVSVAAEAAGAPEKPVDRPEKASKRFLASMNCSQAICEVYGPSFGVPADVAGKMGTGFAGGMGLGSECGAVAGAVAVLGLKYGPDTGRTMVKVTEFIAEFRKRCGETSCSKLLKVDMGTAEGIKAAADKGLFTSVCPGYVKTAGEILDRMLV